MFKYFIEMAMSVLEFFMVGLIIIVDFWVYLFEYVIDHMIAVEYGESYWHQDMIYDLKRKKLIESKGWEYINYLDRIPTLDELRNDIYSLI